MGNDKFTAFLNGLKGLIAEAEGEAGSATGENNATEGLPAPVENKAPEAEDMEEESAPMPPTKPRGVMEQFMSKPKPRM